MLEAGLAIALLTGSFRIEPGLPGQELASNQELSPTAGQQVPPTLSVEEQLEMLLLLRRQHPQWTEAIDAEIRQRFLQTRAILVMDMVGLTATTQNQGIIAALDQIYRLRDLSVPVVESHGGTILKLEADNVYAWFDTPERAVEAADHLLTQLQHANLGASMGIGYGEMLAVGERDLYGHEMNLASRLGEDLAAPNEILLTPLAASALAHSDWPLIPVTQEDSDYGLLTFYQLQRQESRLK